MSRASAWCSSATRRASAWPPTTRLAVEPQTALAVDRRREQRRAGTSVRDGGASTAMTRSPASPAPNTMTRFVTSRVCTSDRSSDSRHSLGPHPPGRARRRGIIATDSGTNRTGMIDRSDEARMRSLPFEPVAGGLLEGCRLATSHGRGPSASRLRWRQMRRGSAEIQEPGDAGEPSGAIEAHCAARGQRHQPRRAVARGQQRVATSHDRVAPSARASPPALPFNSRHGHSALHHRSPARVWRSPDIHKPYAHASDHCACRLVVIWNRFYHAAWREMTLRDRGRPPSAADDQQTADGQPERSEYQTVRIDTRAGQRMSSVFGRIAGPGDRSQQGWLCGRHRRCPTHCDVHDLHVGLLDAPVGWYDTCAPAGDPKENAPDPTSTKKHAARKRRSSTNTYDCARHSRRPEWRAQKIVRVRVRNMNVCDRRGQHVLVLHRPFCTPRPVREPPCRPKAAPQRPEERDGWSAAPRSSTCSRPAARCPPLLPRSRPSRRRRSARPRD